MLWVHRASHRPDRALLMLRIRNLAATRTWYGHFRIDILLRKGGSHRSGASLDSRDGQRAGFHLEGARLLGPCERDVTLRFSRLGKPTDNAFVESFNSRLRDECLSTHWFLFLEDARAKMEAWRRDYNENGPHTSLGWLTPIEYGAAAAKTAAE